MFETGPILVGTNTILINREDVFFYNISMLDTYCKMCLFFLIFSDEEREKTLHEDVKGKCGKHHFARVFFIGKNGVGKTSLMRRLLGQDKKDVMFTESTDGIEVAKCNINIVNGEWSPCDGTNLFFLD